MGEGIVKRGGRYGARIYDPASKSYRWLWSFDSHDEALRAKLDAKQSPARLGTETCEQFADRWIRDFNRSTRDGSPRWGEKTIRDMRGALKPFKRAFGPRPLRTLTTPDVRSWAASQPYKYAAVARTMFSDAVLDGLVATNPFANLRLERSRGRKDIIVLTEPEIEALCDTALEVWPEYGSTVAAMIATAAYTGIRPGELFALEPRDIRISDCELDVRRSYNDVEFKAPKNGRERLGIVLPPQAGERLARMPRSLHGEFLFVPPRGQHFRKSTLYYYWGPVRIAAKRQGMDWYDMRHAAATLLLERGVEPEDVAWQLGHTDAGDLVRQLYGEPHRPDAGRRERIKRAFGQNVAPLRDASADAAVGEAR
jgi:integrase